MAKEKLISVFIKRPVDPSEISEKIFLFRDKKVMLDSDLAALYCVSTKRLNESVRRNIDRFPADFMFQLSVSENEFLRSHFATSKETELLMSQTAILKPGVGGRRYRPYVFTEQGVAMLSSVLKSKRAIHVNVEIMWAFAKIREMILSHKDLQEKINEMERKYDKNFVVVFEALRGLLNSSVKPKRQIGFHVKDQLV